VVELEQAVPLQPRPEVCPLLSCLCHLTQEEKKDSYKPEYKEDKYGKYDDKVRHVWQNTPASSCSWVCMLCK
jgi:hypothetical protein